MIKAGAAASGTCEVTARHRLKAYQQGELDSLCVLLASLNAIRLVMAHHQPLDRRSCRDLMEIGARYLDKKGGLVKAIRDGIGSRRRKALLRHLLRHVQVDGLEIVAEAASDANVKGIEDVWRWMASSFESDCPVLLLLQGGLQHATVATGLTPTRVQLFDSTGMSFVRRASINIKPGTSYYHIDPANLIRLRLVGPDQRRD